MKKIYAIGIGPGSEAVMTGQAQAALRASSVIVGYKVYCDQIRHLVPDHRIISSGMRAEVDRCNLAIDEAVKGETVSVVSSGDAGVYGMAGLILELLTERGIRHVAVTVVPGVTAATAAAAALGAPLMNDFAVISLSDLMTPRHVIEKRLRAVIEADMTCVLYNPRSTRRKEFFDTTRDAFIQARGPDGVCGIVRNATRPDQFVWVGTLRDLPVDEVDMFTVIIMGSSQTRILEGRLVTRRGYQI